LVKQRQNLLAVFHLMAQTAIGSSSACIHLTWDMENHTCMNKNNYQELTNTIYTYTIFCTANPAVCYASHLLLMYCQNTEIYML
jgi:hypothetical protein